MKKVILMMAGAMTLCLASCKTNSEPTEGETVEATTAAEDAPAEEPASVVGVWKLSDLELDMEVPKGKEQVIEDMKKEMIAATVYTFNANGTMTFKNNMVEETAGTYTYADGKITITNNTTKKDETVKVDELTANKLVISSEQGGRKAVMSFIK
jgi:Lipocalin-like domain